MYQIYFRVHYLQRGPQPQGQRNQPPQQQRNPPGFSAVPPGFSAARPEASAAAPRFSAAPPGVTSGSTPVWGPSAQEPQQRFWGPSARQPQQSSWGPSERQPQQSSWGPSAQQPQQSSWRQPGKQQPQQGASGQYTQPPPQQGAQDDQSTSGENPVKKQKGKQKGQITRPQTETGPSKPATSLPPKASSDADVVARKVESVQLSPSKSSALIESSPNGSVYEGKRGRTCIIQANYIQILVDKLIPKAFHYDVSFDPDIPKKMLPVALDRFMSEHFKSCRFAFDSRKNVYTNKLLTADGNALEADGFMREVEAVMGDRSKKFKVKIKLATEVDMSVLKHYKDPQYQNQDKPSQAIQCLDIVLRTVFKAFTLRNEAVSVGRSLYFTPERQLSLGDDMELWLGLFQSAIMGRKSLYLNVDVAHKAFPSAVPVLVLLKNIGRGNLPRNLEDRQDSWKKAELENHLKMLSIGYRLNPNEPMKTYGFNKLVESANKALFVDDSTNTKMSVREYFERVKGKRLQYPDLPCLHVGSKIRTIYLPMEFCEIPAGQATNKKCPPAATAAMIKFSATSTDDRKKKIEELLHRINYSTPGNDIQGFGINVDPAKKFQNIDARVIDPPELKYANGNVQPRSGAWNGRAFLESENDPIKWCIINCDDRTPMNAVEQLKRNILKVAKNQNVRLVDTPGIDDIFSINMLRSRQADMEGILGDCQKKGYKLVVVIIIDRNECYSMVKKAAELKVGILTQCIKSNTIFRMGRGNPLMTVGNILLKVNAKLNGKNQEIVEKSYLTFNSKVDGVMFVGADVTHPSPDQRNIPSVVGVSASYDQHGFRYQCAWRLQDPKQEMIEDLKDILVDHLQFYKKKNGGRLPAKLMYYRDGVSDGQFAEVLNLEMTAIRGALKTIYGLNTPAKVTFIVVQKRHHTRFFPTDPKFSDGRNNNIMPGTVVDKDIVHPFQYQFFLASHAAIQGVTKPAKYCVLVNESKISPDDLQAITYDLCHLFTRCNRSVSYVAPTYYAHLVAARGKQYIVGEKLDMANLKREFLNRSIRPNIVNNSPMFFV